MELLLFIAVLCLLGSLVFKLSLGIVKLAFGFVGILLFVLLIPVGLALIVPFGFLFIAIGLVKTIF